jgi:uncharacterized protein
MTPERKILIDARMASPHIERQSRITGELTAKIAPGIVDDFNAMMRKSGLSREARVTTVWALADRMAAAIAPHAPCKRGCSHCCHIPVGVTATEAAVIGKRIGVEPAKVKHRTDFGNDPWGYAHPCVFLKNGECSIYDDRPTACRIHFNLDIDNELCKMLPVDAPESNPVPFFDDRAFLQMAVLVGGGPVKVVLSALRDFFPKGKPA